MKILFIRPIITERPDYLEEEIINEFSHDGVQVVARHLEYGPQSIENEFDLVYSAPFVLEEAMKAERDGFDGIVSYCFANPGVDASREAVRIPVLGSGEASMALAAMIGRRIGIVTILPNILPLIYKQCQTFFSMGRLAGVRCADIPVTCINNNLEEILDRLYREALNCITEDGADVIVLGCTGFAGFAHQIQKRLEIDGYIVPVIDPAASSLKMMEALVTCRVRNSSITYWPPIAKTIRLPWKSLKEDNQ